MLVSLNLSHVRVKEMLISGEEMKWCLSIYGEAKVIHQQVTCFFVMMPFMMRVL